MSTSKNQTDKELVSVETDVLKERLNKVYQNRRGTTGLQAGSGSQGLFEYLWDLKERALLEHRVSVDVPGNWLDELEDNQQRAAGH